MASTSGAVHGWRLGRTVTAILGSVVGLGLGVSTDFVAPVGLANSANCDPDGAMAHRGPWLVVGVLSAPTSRCVLGSKPHLVTSHGCTKL